LDTNVYCRPLDNQTEKRIRAESKAFMEIAENALQGEIEIVSSDYVKYEIEHIINPFKRKDARGFERTLSSENITRSKQLITLAKELTSKCGLNSLDALHLSAACLGEVNFFLTCDDQILERKSCIEKLATEKKYRLKVRNPINYLSETLRVKKR